MPTLSSACDFTMVFGEHQLCAEFEVANPSRGGCQEFNIEFKHLSMTTLIRYSRRIVLIKIGAVLDQNIGVGG